MSRLFENPPAKGPRLVALIAALLVLKILLYALVVQRFTQLPHALCSWDCNWFVHTATMGYDHHVSQRTGTLMQANWVDFPVYPLLMRLAALNLHLSFSLAGMLVSNLFMGIFVYFAVQYQRIVAPSLSSIALVAFLFAYPSGFYLSVAYSEATYAAFTMVAFYFLALRRDLFSAIAAGALAGTRVTGVLFTPILVVRRLLVMRTAYQTGGMRALVDATLASILPIALAPLGLFIFMAYLYFYMGDAFAFKHIQIGWNRVEQNPAWVIYHALQSFDFFTVSWKKTLSGSFAACCAIVGLLLSLRLFMLKRYAECWSLASLILIACSAGLTAFPRYCLANPVFMIALFECLWQKRLRAAFVPIMVVFLGLQLLLIHLWALSYGFLI